MGTVVRTGEDEDPIAVMTVLNTQQHKGSGFMAHIRDHMLAKCKDAAVKQQLSKVRRHTTRFCFGRGEGLPDFGRGRVRHTLLAIPLPG